MRTKKVGFCKTDFAPGRVNYKGSKIYSKIVRVERNLDMQNLAVTLSVLFRADEESVILQDKEGKLYLKSPEGTTYLISLAITPVDVDEEAFARANYEEVNRDTIYDPSSEEEDFNPTYTEYDEPILIENCTLEEHGLEVAAPIEASYDC